MAYGYELVEGRTAPIPFTVYRGAVVVNLTGATVSLIFLDVTGAPVVVGGSVQVLDAPNGSCQYTPLAADFDYKKSPYTVHVKADSGASGVRFYPRGAGDFWRVYRGAT